MQTISFFQISVCMMCLFNHLQPGTHIIVSGEKVIDVGSSMEVNLETTANERDTSRQAKGERSIGALRFFWEGEWMRD